jgi:hypothetical protein
MLEYKEEELIEYEIKSDYIYNYKLRSSKGFSELNAEQLSLRLNLYYAKSQDTFEAIDELLESKYLLVNMSIGEIENINELNVTFTFSFNTDLGEEAIDMFGRSYVLPQKEIKFLWDKFEEHKHLFDRVAKGILKVFISDRRHMSIDSKETTAFMKEKKVKTKIKTQKEIETKTEEKALER